MKKTRIVILALFLMLYIVVQSTNYYLEYSIEQYEKQIEKKNEEIDNLLVESNVELSRDNAINEHGLKLNNNVYYLEEDNNEKD